MHLGWVSFSFGRGKKRRIGERGSDSRQKGGGENSCPPLFLFFPPPPGPEWVPALIKPSRGGEGPPLPPPEVIRSPSVLPLPSRHLGKVSCPLWPLSACPSLVSFLVSLKRRQLQSGAETKARKKARVKEILSGFARGVAPFNSLFLEMATGLPLPVSSYPYCARVLS